MNRDNRNEYWNENRNRYQQDDQFSNWHNSNQQMDSNRNRGGFMGATGSNYASGAFSGVAYGRGLTEDNYRGYNNMGNMQGNFASNYNAAYGDQWHNTYQENKGDYGNRGRVNFIPDNNENRRDSDQDRRQRPASEFGYGGHYGAGGSYGSFGGPATSRLNESFAGGHKGKGPKGYQRSDQRILEDVNDRLSDDPHIDASDIEVKLENGTVILSGHVPDKAAKRRAEDIAESVRGVSNVENRLRVGEGILANVAKAFTSVIGDVTVGHEVDRK